MHRALPRHPGRGRAMARTLSVAVAVAAALAALGGVAAQARPPRCPPAADCAVNRLDTGLAEFTVQGNYFGIEYVDGEYVSVRCGAGGPSLLAAALPSFASALRVARVAVERCAGAPYAAVLRALNVSLARPFHLTVAGARALAPAHLAGLADAGLRALTLRGAGAPAGPLLAQLPGLLALTLTSTRLPAGELEAPPRSLERLYLMNAGVARVPAAVLALPALRSLTVMSEGPVHVERAGAGAGAGAEGAQLRSLHVSEAEAALLAEWAPPALEAAYLARWGAAEPAPLRACAALASLTLVEPVTRALPPAWVARCPRLATLELTFARRLARLPARLLANASSLERLVLRSGALTSLPPDLFEGAPRLAHLDLSGNRLADLPSGVLAPGARALRELSLAGNALGAGVGAALRPLRELRRLSLADNPVPDLCRRDALAYVSVVKNKSPLASLSKLEILNLKNTNVGEICDDWRTDLQLLAELDLRGTRVATLTAEDLVYRRRVSAVVRLTDTPLQNVFFTAEDYDAAVARRARAATATGNVTVTLGGRGTNLTCDCYLYWVARALKEGVLPVSPEAELRCAGGGALRDLRPDELACGAPAGACPARLPRACACAAAGGLRSGRAVLRVRCERAGLARVPRLRDHPDVGAVDLLLAGNSIADLTVDDVPHLFRNLDLRNNSIERIDEATARALVGGGEGGEGGGRRVQLAGNPLDCSCGLAGARRVLRAGAAALPGYGETLRCRAGGLLAEAPECGEAPAPALAASLAALAAAAALGGGVLAARRGVLRRLKAVLARARAAPEPARPYDVFVTFGRGDEPAALALAARLEGGARRVLLQERDWLPPAWVPQCIAASARAARRTVALVSPAWERSLESAEVRAAYEAAWRGALLLVLPPAPAPAPADPALRRYARDHPHLVLRRGERAFWRGLERALPPPPPAPAPPTA